MQRNIPRAPFLTGRYRYIDYRYLNKNSIKPRYAFGHGLSYTSFSFSNATIKQVTKLTSTPPTRPAKGPTPSYSSDIPTASEAYFPDGFNKIWRYIYSWLSKGDADAAAAAASKGEYAYPAGYSTEEKEGPPAGGAQGGNPALWDVAYEVSVTVTNSGTERAGKAVAQAYVQFPEDIPWDTPVVQLRDFEKTKELQPGDEQVLTLQFTRKDVSVWDVESQNWVVPSVEGRFKFWVGSASDSLEVACYSDTLKCEEGLESPV